MQRYYNFTTYAIVADILPTKMLQYAYLCTFLPTIIYAYTRAIVHPYPIPPETQRGHIIITARAWYILA